MDLTFFSNQLQFLVNEHTINLLNQSTVNQSDTIHIMPKVHSNNTRRKPAFYNFINQNGDPVQINLNGYTARCTITGDEKRFHHSYLARLIQDKYDNNIDVFEQNYVSRAGRGELRQAERQQQIQDRIVQLAEQIKELQSQLV